MRSCAKRGGHGNCLRKLKLVLAPRRDGSRGDIKLTGLRIAAACCFSSNFFLKVLGIPRLLCQPESSISSVGRFHKYSRGLDKRQTDEHFRGQHVDVTVVPHHEMPEIQTGPGVSSRVVGIKESKTIHINEGLRGACGIAITWSGQISHKNEPPRDILPEATPSSISGTVLREACVSATNPDGTAGLLSTRRRARKQTRRVDISYRQWYGLG